MNFWSGVWDRVFSLQRARDAENGMLGGCNSRAIIAGSPQGVELERVKYLEDIKALAQEKEQRDRRKEKIKNPQSIYLRKKKCKKITTN